MENVHLIHKQNHDEDMNSMLKLELENFGPIASGKIELKPLTIFMGSNNSGKSYAALLIYSIMNSEHQSMHEILDEVFIHMKKMIKLEERHDATYEMTSFAVQDKKYKNFEDELSRNFSSQLSELVQINQTMCTLKISSSILTAKITVSDNAMQYPISKDQYINVEADSYNKNNRKLVSINNNSVTIHTDTITRQRITEIMNEMSSLYHESIPLIRYLPASRYGVLQSHKILASQIIKNAHYAGLADFHVPTMPGAITDFLVSLLEMPKRNLHSTIADQLEKEMLHGAIEMKNSEPSYEINYRYRDQLVPLHRASSMVSEMAPLVLYLRHLVKSGSVLIIEEPESHLHPNHQIYLAKYIVSLVRQGVYVLITTHSPYLVEMIGNYLQAGGLSDSKREKLQENKDCYIKLHEIAAYLFEIKENISTIKKVDVSVEDGIDQRPFVEAYANISEDSRKIEKHYEYT